jgi:DNA-directed RNA polymerase subunit RPC12/RpoP
MSDVATAAEEVEESSAEAVPRQLSERVHGLACPNCGGALEVVSGLRVVSCSYCGTRLLALSEVGIRRFAVEPQIDSSRARALAKEWLSRGVAKDRRLRREATIGEAFLSFLPFFRAQADCVGFALGTEERRRTVGSGKNRRVETYEVDVERRAEESFDRTYPAVNVAEWGIRRIDLRGDPLVPFEQDLLDRFGMVFPVTGSEKEVMSTAIEAFKRQTDPARGLKRVRMRFLATLRERMSIVYYPLWIVRYRFRERSYQVLVDAEDGSLAYGKAPGNDLYRALMLVGAEAVAMFLGTTALQWMGGGFISLAFVGGIALAFMAWGWRRFRYGGVVEEGTGLRGEAGLEDATASIGQLRAFDGQQVARSLIRALGSGRLRGGKR